MSGEGLENNVRSVLQLLTVSSGKGERGQRRLLFRTLAGPPQLPEVVQKIEMLQSIKETLPKSMWDVVDDIYDQLINALISTTSVKGATLTMLTTQKSEFKVNHPALKRAISNRFIGGGGGGQGNFE